MLIVRSIMQHKNTYILSGCVGEGCQGAVPDQNHRLSGPGDRDKPAGQPSPSGLNRAGR